MTTSFRLRATATTLLALLALRAAAELPDYRFDPERVPVGQLLHFAKSNLDGSRAARVSVYVAAQDRLESLKWGSDESRATLVVAGIDWARMSVKSFEVWQLERGTAPAKRLTLDTRGDQLFVSMFEKPILVTHWPWHSYDFDFTSLAFSMPHLRAPEGGVRFWRTDYVHGDPPEFRELGEVMLRFESTESHGGRTTRRYAITGPGIENETGTWWADATTGLLVEYEMPIGDEPGYDSVRFKLERMEALTPDQWQSFRRTAVGDSPN